MNEKLENIEKRINKNSIKILIVLITSSIIIKLYFTPFNIPISQDGIDYFAHAIAMSRDNTIPNGYILTNIGWSSFVSLFFSVVGDQEMLTLMNIQRFLSIIVSTFIAIPVYLLSKIFFKKEISILAATLILFDPRLIENSILGITDSLFILLVTSGIYFIFHQKGKLIYLSFVLISLSIFVRYEGLLLIIPLMISYILKSKEFNFSKIKFIIGILLFLTITISINFIIYENNETNVFDIFISPFNYFSETIITNESDEDDKFFATNENHLIIFMENAIGGFFKYLGWILLPTFIIFCLLGIIFMPKKITKNKIIFGLFFIFLALSSIFAYGRGFQETRYLLVLLPIITLLACYGLNYLLKINLKKLTITILSVIIISSFIFIEFRNENIEYENDMYKAALLLTNDGSGVNHYNKDKFIKVADLQNNWPNLLEKGENKKMKMITEKFSVNEFDDPLEFIKFNKNKGLTHLLIKEGNNKGFFDKIFLNEANYPFLEKIYDSDSMTKYKIFKINYEKLK